MVKTRQWILARKPKDLPQLEGKEPTFELKENDLPDLKDDELLVKLVYLSNDPAQRGWINKDVDPERLYVPPVKEGTPMHARGLAEVVESKSSKYSKGDIVIGSTGWSEHAILSAKSVQPATDLPGGLSKTHYLGALGLTGLTAYFGLMEVGAVTKDDTLVVSGAAGATGMMVVQIAKKIIGCKKVVGLAGTDEKCKWVESLGADVCLNYKKDNFKDSLSRALPRPDGWATVYYDNVGGDMLNMMLTYMARYGRIICCGAIATYNSSSDELPGIKNWFEVISMRLKCQGFIVIDYMHKSGEAIDVFKKALSDGKLQIEEGEHIVNAKFEEIPQTWLKLFSGENTGKLVTAIQSNPAHKL